MRTVDKYGGIDSYLLHCKAKKLGPGLAQDLRAQLKSVVRQDPSLLPAVPAHLVRE